FTEGQDVNVSYSCSDDDQTMTTPANCKGYQCPAGATSFDPCTILTPAADDPTNVYGHALDTSTPGDYVFTVWAVDDQGNSNSNGTPSDSGVPAGVAVVNATDGEQLVLGARLTGCNIVLQVSRKQKSFRSKGLIVKVRSDRACSIKMNGKLIPAKSAKSRKA